MAREDLLAAAQALIGADDPVTAAGVLGLQDDYAAITVGGIVSGIATPDAASPVLAGAGAAASLKATRQESARSQGLTVRMLVVVTARSIHILSLPMAGNTPQKELMSFERGGTKVEISKFGLSRRLKLTDSGSGQHLGLTGSAAPFSSFSKGDKAVLAELG